MAKQLLKKYSFKPGVSYLGNLKPNAYELILANKTYLKKEVTAFLNAQVLDSVKCERDLGYIVDGAAFDVALGTNYNAVFLGIAQYNSLEVSPTVIRNIQRAKLSTLLLTAVAADATATTRATNFFNEVVDIASNGRANADTVTFTNPSSATASQIAAKDRLIANKNFLAAEVNAWVGLTYPSHNHDEAKCTRDVKYAIDALCYDILYGGNSATYAQAKFFFYFSANNATGITALHKAQTVAAYGRLKTIVGQVVRGDTVAKTTTGTTPNALTQSTAGSNASGGDATILEGYVQITADVVNAVDQAAANTVLAGISKTSPAYAWATAPLQAAKVAIDANKSAIITYANGLIGYTFDDAKCERDTNYVLDAYLFDLRYGGNEDIRRVSSKYWNGDVPQIDGNRIAEVEAHSFLRDLINTYILTNTAAPSYQAVVSQVIDLSKTRESDAVARITELTGILIQVVEFGTTFLPAEVTGVSRIKFPKKYEQANVLLITNTTKNEIIYDFSDPSAGANIAFIREDVSDFPRLLEWAQGYTVLTLFYDTRTMSVTDDIQIFVDEEYQVTRPYKFGTDAMERMRVGQPQAMLDADFEYGLQPTKWQAIATSRGYPSTYEIPGSDLIVSLCTTDASTGSAGVGPSLITVTTVAPHFLLAGTPISIKALASSITGFSRAEGTFLVNTVPSENTFTYYAKSRVGNVNGAPIATSYTQLRLAGFYTGASIGSPTFTVASQGSSGTITSLLSSPAGTTTVAFSGTAPLVSNPIRTVTARFTGNCTTSTVLTVTAISVGTIVNNLDLAGTGVANNTKILSQLTSTESGGTLGGRGTYQMSGSAQTISSTTITGSSVNLGTQIASVVGTGGTIATVYASANVAIGATEIPLVDATGVVPGAVIDNGSGAPMEVSSVVGNTVYFLSPRTTRLVGDGGIYNNVVGTNIASSGNGLVVTLGSGGNAYTISSIDQTGDNYNTNDLIVIPGSDITYYTSTVLLVHFDQNPTGPYASLGFFDIANGVQPTITGAGTDALLTENIKRFGRSSLFLNNPTTLAATATGYLDYAINNNFIFGAGDFEIEAQFYPTTLGTATSKTLFDFREQSPDAAIVLRINSNNNLVITIDGVEVIVGDSTLTTNQWYHIAISRTGNILRLFTNGSQEGANYTDNVSYQSHIKVRLGADFTGARGFAGYIDEFRIRTISTIYTGSYIVPTVPYTYDAQGSSINSVTVKVTNTFSTGGVQSLEVVSGTPPLNGEVFRQLSTGTVQIPVGINGSFNVTRSAGIYSGVAILSSGSGYLAGNLINISNTLLDGGGDTAKDLLLQVVSVGVNGAIQTVSAISGVATLSGTPIPVLSSIDFNEALQAALPAGRDLEYSAIASINVAFPNAHGLVPGQGISVVISSAGTNQSLLNGPFVVEQVPNLQTIRFSARSSGTIGTSPTIAGTIYPRTDAFFLHRPFDGGVLLSTGTPAHGAQAVRMSKKYIRYQSGKGAMYNTGALFAPSYDLRSLTADGTAPNSLITITVDDNDHGVQIGATVRITGVVTTGYNNDYSVVDVVDERVYKVRAKTQLGNVTATIGSSCQMAHIGWHGAVVRAGAFDDQNGIFFEYNGRELAVVRRSSTFQVAGTVSINADSNLCSGTNTRFLDQIVAGDRIIIKGMTHVVTGISNNTTMTVNPDFRGVSNVVNAKICLIQDYRIPQSEWNQDTCDGNGPSGYIIDITKMQMIGMQYSWYGAGFIDWMFRGPNGDYVFAHRLKGNNLNTEAYMRTGNLPVRYEVLNESARNKLGIILTSNATSLTVLDGSQFPDFGTVYIDNELISYTSKTGNVLGGLSRAVSLNNFNAGSQRTYTAGAAAVHTAGTGVNLVSVLSSPLISHWGSAYMIDGQFDTDRGYIFNYQITNFAVTTVKSTAFAIRLAPSVSNAITGDLGERELLNRAQLLLNSLEIVGGTASANSFVIEGVLNPLNYPVTTTDINWFGLTSTAQGGQPSFAQIANGSSILWLNTGSASATPITTFTTNPVARIRVAVFTASEVSAVRLGYVVSAGANIQPGTVVEKIEFNVPSAGQTRITISKDVTAQVTGAVTFAAPSYAQPGEQVFAFVAPLGTREVIDLSGLKELTSTAIGGRGTFPNGPDVLAINIYVTGGTATSANLILRWGEAQA